MNEDKPKPPGWGTICILAVILLTVQIICYAQEVEIERLQSRVTALEGKTP